MLEMLKSYSLTEARKGDKSEDRQIYNAFAEKSNVYIYL